MAKVFYDDVLIELSVIDTGEGHEGFIQRQDKYRTKFFDHVSDASKGRLEAFATKMRDKGFKVQGKRNGNYLRFFIFLQERIG